MRLPSLFRRPTICFLVVSLALSSLSAEANAVAFDVSLFGSARVAPSEAGSGLLELAQGGCSAAAAQAAAETGGQVLSVQVADRGGQTVCVVTVLVPGRDGSRPRRQTITVPQ